MSNHNKKRNVGLIYEQLIRYTSKCILEGKNDKAEIAMSIMNDHFKPGTELYKEFRLFNALAQTYVDSENLAIRILDEAKSSALGHNSRQLDNEKSMLIRNINKKLDFPGFFDMRIPNYRKLATVQTLLNTWRNTSGITTPELAIHESRVVGYLTHKEQKVGVVKKPEVTSLSLKLMQEKLERKYSDSLSNEQIALINTYVKSSTRGDSKSLMESCKSIKTRAINALKKLSTEKNEKIITEKFDPVKKEISSLPEEKIQEADLSRYLTLIKLISEVENKDAK
jgi:hypothetical protein